MKNKAGLIVPVLMILFGVYALFATMNGNGEYVVLISGYGVPHNLSAVSGLAELIGGVGALISSLLGGARPL